jgi:HEAT repeat protein
MKKSCAAGLVCIFFAFPTSARADFKSKTVPELLVFLDHESPKVQAQAIRELGLRGAAAKDAVPRLFKAFHSTDKDVQAQAGKALGRIGSPAVSVLVDELKNPSSRVLEQTALSLAAMGPEAHPAVAGLSACLKHKDALVRATASYALGEIGPPARKAAASLVVLLDDPTKTVQKSARAALASIGPGTLPVLRGALKSPRPAIRQQAAVLIMLQGADASEACADLLPLLQDKKPAVRAATALALGAIGKSAKGALPVLMDLAEDKDASVRAAAASALGDASSDAGPAVSTLVRLFRDPVPAVRLQAALAVVKIGPSAVNVLINTVPNDNLNMRVSAMYALGEIGAAARDAVPILLDNVKDPQPVIRGAAAVAVGKIGPRPAQDAIKKLKDCLKDEQEGAVRVSYSLALAQLQPHDAEAEQNLTREANTFVVATNQAFFKKIVRDATRPRTPAELQRHAKVQGVLNFYVYRNSFRFGDGLDAWSHGVLNQLGFEAIPAMVDTLNSETTLGGVEGYIWKGMAVVDRPQPGGRGTIFFH